MSDLIEIFNASLQTGYIDKAVLSHQEYQPELLVNQKSPPKKILSTLLNQFENCTEFYVSVAFVTTSGVASIINKLQQLSDRGIKGQVLVSQYLNFTQPEALRRLAQFNNIELRIAVSGNAHAKGYIFKIDDHYNVIVGSSNLTAQALATNKEWNIKFSALEESGIIENVLTEFREDFEKAVPVTAAYIEDYERIYKNQLLFSQRSIAESITDVSAAVSPNTMQQAALENLSRLRAEKKNKALIISATGTGKTFLAAFDAKVFNPKKLLFVVHRLTIAQSALETFRKVFGVQKNMGLFSGTRKELECDFIFSTIQTISKQDHLANFPRDYFDYIIIDETHRSGADSYSRLLEHFQPKFLLGMTATPERTDGYDIFQLFDHNIAYEIRLNQAMDEDMVSPFHYYGISDLTIDDHPVEDKIDFNVLVAEERVTQIIEKATFYGSDNGITRGLIFCSKKEEAIKLSNLLNSRGLKTLALTDNSSEADRVRAMEKLETDDSNERIDYILTVDIFNEGIDIPKINQIIMLRPTKSAIIFIQQLGRGLRKVDGKHYLTVIDFIGNYNNNYLIPIALFGDTSYNKDTLRKLITEGSRMIPGASTINFDAITKEKIFQSIDTANLQLLRDLKSDYKLLKSKLGRIPMMMDFIYHGSRDPYLFVENSSSYFNFISRFENENFLNISTREKKLLELFSKEINNSKRVEESIIIKYIIEKGQISLTKLRSEILSKFNYIVSDETIQSCVANLNFEFIREKKDGQLLPVREIYDLEIVQIDNDILLPSPSFSVHLKQETFKTFLLDSVYYSIYEFEKQFNSESWQNGFVLYRKYSRKDVFRILNVAQNPVAQNVSGYLVSSDNKHCPIFVTYHKDEHISESTKYEDEFINNRSFKWMSKSNRTKKSGDVQSILGEKGQIRLLLFIKKSNDEGLDFYYMGDVRPDLSEVTEKSMKNDEGKRLPVVQFLFTLENPVPYSLFNYLQEKTTSITLKAKTKKEDLPKQTVLEFTERGLHSIPFYDFYAAAGTFSEIQSGKEYSLLNCKGIDNTDNKYFACRIVGESMNRVIPNGSVCLFKKYEAGTRNGKIVLVESRDIQDPDFNSAFTIKTYSSQKSIGENDWAHTTITLSPNSVDSKYKPITIHADDSSELRVIGEFVRIINTDEVEQSV